MYTVSDIIKDVDRGIAANNMIETYFSYRIFYYVNEGNKGAKHTEDTPYNGLRKALENIIRNNLSVTNTVVIAEVTAWKDGESVSLMGRPYGFNLSGYFEQIAGRKEKGYIRGSYGRRAGRC